MRRLSARGDDGAVTVTLAVVLGCGMLLGLAAVVVDVGRLYAEREQLQSGADAAALAVAEQCVRRPDRCGDQAATALAYAERNAADGAAAVTVVCGRAPGLAGCPPPAGNRTDCLAAAPEAGSYAEVRTRTRMPDGATLLPPAFAGAASGGAYGGSDVGACARVAWGPPQVSRGVAVTFSLCEWAEFTERGTVFWPEPALGLPPDSAERIVYLKGAGDATTCPAGPSGWDRPGGFGWLDDPGGTCETEVRVDGSFGGDTGNAVSQPCRTVLADVRARHAVSFLPIYDGVRGQGEHTVYHLAGFASFVITGYHMSGFTARSWLTGGNRCTGDQRCLYGYFTRGLLPTTGRQIAGPDLGLSVVNLVG